MPQPYDSLIFDMDGTLWDAVDSYAEIWNVTSREHGVDRVVTRGDLLRYMGRPLREIFNELFRGIDVDAEKYLEGIARNDPKMMPVLGGRLYEGVREGIGRLAQKYKLTMVSNCGATGLRDFLKFTGLAPYFIDTLTNGENGLDKADNIRLICQRNGLKSPAYVGDIQRDSDAAHDAGVDMIHVTYGFGTCNDAQLSFDSFTQLTDYLTK